MKKPWIDIALVFVVVTTAVLVAGCGGKATIKSPDGRKYDLQEQRYETLWIEPQIVYSDSIITLIRSDRIDSAIVDPVEKASRPASSIEIRIVEPSCQVTVGLYNSDFQMVYPLLVRDLRTGFYRLNVNMDIFRQPPPVYETYLLKADFCGRTEIALVGSGQ